MPGIPPQPGTAGAGHGGHLLYPQDIAARELCPSVRTLVIHSLWPLHFSRRKHTCSYLSSALFSFSSSYGRASLGGREIQRGEPKLNVLEMSTRQWWSHSMVTSQRESPWRAGCSSLFLQAVLPQPHVRPKVYGAELSACSCPSPGMLVHGHGPFPSLHAPTPRSCCPTYLRTPTGSSRSLSRSHQPGEAGSDLLLCAEGSYQPRPTQLLIARIDEPLMSFALTSSQINTRHVAAGGAPRATGKTPGAGKDEAPRAWPRAWCQKPSGRMGCFGPVTQALSLSEGFLAAPGESHLLGSVWAQQGGCWSWQEAQLWPELALYQS